MDDNTGNPERLDGLPGSLPDKARIYGIDDTTTFPSVSPAVGDGGGGSAAPRFVAPIVPQTEVPPRAKAADDSGKLTESSKDARELLHRENWIGKVATLLALDIHGKMSRTTAAQAGAAGLLLMVQGCIDIFAWTIAFHWAFQAIEQHGSDSRFWQAPMAWLAALLFAWLISGVIFMYDWFLLTAPMASGAFGWLRLGFLARLATALFFSGIVAVPLELLVMQEEIEQEIKLAEAVNMKRVVDGKKQQCEKREKDKENIVVLDQQQKALGEKKEQAESAATRLLALKGQLGERLGEQTCVAGIDGLKPTGAKREIKEIKGLLLSISETRPLGKTLEEVLGNNARRLLAEGKTAALDDTVETAFEAWGTADSELGNNWATCRNTCKMSNPDGPGRVTCSDGRKKARCGSEKPAFGDKAGPKKDAEACYVQVKERLIAVNGLASSIAESGQAHATASVEAKEQGEKLDTQAATDKKAERDRKAERIQACQNQVEAEVLKVPKDRLPDAVSEKLSSVKVPSTPTVSWSEFSPNDVEKLTGEPITVPKSLAARYAILDRITDDQAAPTVERRASARYNNRVKWGIRVFFLALAVLVVIAKLMFNEATRCYYRYGKDPLLDPGHEPGHFVF